MVAFRIVRLVLIPSACSVFFVGLAVSAVPFYRGKPFDAKTAVISDLESPEDNPHGYGAAALGTATCGILLTPVAVSFYRRLRSVRRKLAFTGALMFASGLAAAIAIGLLAPFTSGYPRLHIQLAFAAFIGICSGTLLSLVAARATPALAVVQSVALLFLLYLYFAPAFFNNDRLLTSLAFWEWMLCLDCAVALWMLGAALDRIRPNISTAHV
ncbi:MAG: hypothetical protein WAM69_11625 [Candidatus Sulfotelmatobacter sp.]